MRGFAFRSLQTRLLVWLVALLTLIQVGVYYGVQTASIRNARANIENALEVTAATLERTLDNRRQALREKARLLSSDFAFKEAFADNDHDTLQSALDNYQTRARASAMLLVTFEGKLLVSTDRSQTSGSDFALPWLLQRADQQAQREATGIAEFNGDVMQLVVVPLFMPAPAAWIVIGFPVADTFAHELGEQTRSDVSVLLQRPGQVHVVASTLDANSRQKLPEVVVPLIGMAGRSVDLPLPQRDYIGLLLSLDRQETGGIWAVLQRPLDDALASFKRLQLWLLLVFALALLLSLLLSYVLARRVSRPVRELAIGAAAIREGHYPEVKGVDQLDELGQLARQFNDMVKGLRERDEVRGLLGKVVSPQVAEELMRRPPVLGGEAREVSLLFSDIRDFTSLCEQFSAHDIVEFLNAYLTRMSDLVDRHNGVVDKYIGDAIMAVFGAPLARPLHAADAVRSALAMVDALSTLHQEFASRGWPRFQIGVGIHTGEAVVGNMGSENRLNYTVIGDTVNLASRLEGLCKFYGVPIVVSGSTRRACPTLPFRELDRVRVKGRHEPVVIFEPLPTEPGSADFSVTALRLTEHDAALRDYRAGRFAEAEQRFAQLQDLSRPCRLYALYLERCQYYLRTPPEEGWDGVHSFDSK